MSELKPCPFCGGAESCDFRYPHPTIEYKATRKTPVNIGEIIEQVRALKSEHAITSRQYQKNLTLDKVIEILERYR